MPTLLRDVGMAPPIFEFFINHATMPPNAAETRNQNALRDLRDSA